MLNRMAERAARLAKVAKQGVLSFNPPAGVDVWCPKKEETYDLDIIPYIITKPNHPDGSLIGEEFKIGEDWYRRPYGTHFKVDGIHTVVCPLESFGKPCPICEARKKLDYERNKELYNKLKVKKRVLFNLYNTETGKYVIFDWEASKFSTQLEVEIEKNKDKMVSAFASLKGGRTLSIRSVEDSFAGKKYFKVDRIDFAKREDIAQTVLDAAPKLDDLVIETSYNRIKEIFESVPNKEDGNDGDDEPVGPRKSRQVEEAPIATRIKKAVLSDDDGEADGVEHLPARKPKPALEAPAIPPPSIKKAVAETDDEEWEE